MKKNLSLLFCLFLTFYAFTQNTDALVKAEKDFEDSSLSMGIKDGFTFFADAMGIIFDNKGPVNAKKFWSALPPFDGVFNWSPAYAEMAITGDWGYTTGNYTHSKKSQPDSIDGSGQYTTVWNRISTGEWKYLIDIGNSHNYAPLDTHCKTILHEKYLSDDKNMRDALLKQEKQFIERYEKDPATAYEKYGSTDFILNVTGSQPILSVSNAIPLINGISPRIKYSPSDVKVSPGSDMAAVYGTMEQHDKKGYYVRIWRFERKGWKLALETLHL